MVPHDGEKTVFQFQPAEHRYLTATSLKRAVRDVAGGDDHVGLLLADAAQHAREQLHAAVGAEMQVCELHDAQARELRRQLFRFDRYARRFDDLSLPHAGGYGG